MSVKSQVFKYNTSSGSFYGFDFRLKGYRIRKKGFFTEREANLVLESIRASIFLGSYDPTKEKDLEGARNINFNDVFEEWMSVAILRNSTRQNFISLHRKHLKETVGSLKIQSITSKKLNNLMIKQSKNYSGGTLGRVRSLIKCVFKYAEEKGFIKDIPEIKLPKSESASDRTFLPMNKVRILIDWMYTNKSQFFDGSVELVHILSLTGLRVGEALGLKSVDIDIKNKRIKVSRTLYKGMPNPPKNGKILTVPIHPELVPVIEGLLIMAAGKDGNEDGYIFTSPNTGKPMSHNYIYGIIKKAGLKSLGLKSGVTPHTFRRSISQYLIQEGFDISQVSALLRNTNDMVLKHYSKSGQAKLEQEFPKLQLVTNISS